jgi:hypothetical protein
MNKPVTSGVGKVSRTTKHKAKQFFTVVNIALYAQNIIFSINQDDDQFLKSLQNSSKLRPKGSKKYTLEDLEGLLVPFENLSSSVLGRTVCYTNGVIAVRLFKPESIYEPYQLGTLTHEIFHAVNFIAENRGLTLTTSSEEAYAYLIGYITESFFEDYQKAN